MIQGAGLGFRVLVLGSCLRAPASTYTKALRWGIENQFDEDVVNFWQPMLTNWLAEVAREGITHDARCRFPAKWG